MTCNHLQQLYKLCEDNQLRLSSSDLVHLVCLQCGRQEVCPSTLVDEYDARRTSRRKRTRTRREAASPPRPSPESPEQTLDPRP